MEMPKNLTGVEDFIRALGMQRSRRTEQDILPSLALFGAGLLVGAALALLLTPVSGPELREELGERVRTAGAAGASLAHGEHAG